MFLRVSAEEFAYICEKNHISLFFFGGKNKCMIITSQEKSEELN